MAMPPSSMKAAPICSGSPAPAARELCTARHAHAAEPRRGNRKHCTGVSPRKFRSVGLAPEERSCLTPAVKPRATARCSGVFSSSSTGSSMQPRNRWCSRSTKTSASLPICVFWTASTKRPLSTKLPTMARTVARFSSSWKTLPSKLSFVASTNRWSSSPFKECGGLASCRTTPHVDENLSSWEPSKAIWSSEKHHPDSVYGPTVPVTSSQTRTGNIEYSTPMFGKHCLNKASSSSLRGSTTPSKAMPC
mmetsp:Transcript_128377/g.410472  ORF Transcript_128377/g.410472 Transcript_128377/m.410472 type:complete len:249 (-) Transcript_128377:1097-1843(-)